MDEIENGSMGEPGGEAGQSTGDAGQGGEGFAGFDSPEALAEAYQGLVSEKTTLTDQIKNLETLRGQHGTEIGNLRQQLATLSGKLEAFNSMPPQPSGPTENLDSIALKLSNGDISESEAIKMAAEISSKETETKLGRQLEERLSSEINKIKSETAREKYVSKFLGDNPGYKEAYDSGKLNPWLNNGISGEEAWLHYQLQATKTELDSLKAQSKKAAEEAEKKGLEKGVQIEKGKSAAGKVLSGKGTAFSQHQGNYDLSNSAGRRQAGIDRLNQIRSGTG